MSERRPCVRCSRAIDASARICPFCNQDQTQPVPAATPAPEPVAAYKPPEDVDIRRKLAIAGAGVLLLFVAFGVGTLINSDDAPKTAPPPVAEKPIDDDVVRSGKRADTQLVPANEPIGEAPITSAPAAAPNANVPNEYQRHDATAVSSVEYQQLAARAQAEKRTTTQSMIDPMTLTGPAYAQAPRPRRRTIAAPPTEGQTAAVASPSRTRPVAEYQPLPDVHISESRTVHLDLMVGADGRVDDITIRGVVPGQTAQILSAVRRWRYRPATENGQPVAAPVSVELSFRGNE